MKHHKILFKAKEFIIKLGNTLVYLKKRKFKLHKNDHKIKIKKIYFYKKKQKL
jgi:hypothetical protein